MNVTEAVIQVPKNEKAWPAEVIALLDFVDNFEGDARNADLPASLQKDPLRIALHRKLLNTDAAPAHQGPIIAVETGSAEAVEHVAAYLPSLNPTYWLSSYGRSELAMYRLSRPAAAALTSQATFAPDTHLGVGTLPDPKQVGPANVSSNHPRLDESYIASITGQRQRMLVAVLNGKGPVPIDDILLSVYGEADHARCEALLKAKERANRHLCKDNSGYEIQRRGNTLSLSRQ